MLDFVIVTERNPKKELIEIYPDFQVQKSRDLMTRSNQFYAIWDEEQGLWSTDEYDVQRLVDAEIDRYRDKRKSEVEDGVSVVSKHMRRNSTKLWSEFRRFVNVLPDSSHQLDEGLTFANTKVKKTDYVSKRLPYSLEEGSVAAWNEIVGTLYDPEERAKIEWVIGAIVSGDSTSIEKFLYFYGAQGAGKSTIIKIIQWMFPGYYTTFNAKALTSSNNAFSLEAFRTNPLIAIEHDGDLSRIEDNSKFNALISHEELEMNEKFKASRMARFNAFPIMASNKPVKITDAKSGIIRRVIDVEPSGRRFSPRAYQALMETVKFELGSIAFYCLGVYREMGKDFYSNYVPLRMMLKTDAFYNFIEEHFEVFKEQNGVTLRQAWAMYKEWAKETYIEYPITQHRFREELANYFLKFEERVQVDGVQLRSWYSEFNTQRFKIQGKEASVLPLVMDQQTSIFDDLFGDQPAQYTNASENPRKYWTNDPRLVEGEWVTPRADQVVSTILSEIDTHELHYVKVPENHIVIDFDLKGEDGNKSAELNLEAASKWPATYSELSKGGAGIHLHYTWSGDVNELSRIYAEGIEVKVFTGNSSLRRKLSYCNNVPVATISSGIPLKEKKMISNNTIKSEKDLRDRVMANIRKEVHPSTKPSIDFIDHLLNEAYESGLPYDLSDMKTKLFAFANSSSNQALPCIKIVQRMKLTGKPEALEETAKSQDLVPRNDKRKAYFDVEVFPNLFVICWKFAGSSTVTRMINPSAQAVEELFQLMLVGFNNRKYDNHIIYAASMGFTNEQLYKLSKKIIDKGQGAFFGAAYNLSHGDIYDYSSKKQSLKVWEIELGLHHLELGLPWDEPVDKSLWDKVAEYCENDVVATEAVDEACNADYVARQILAELSGLSINDTTNSHTARIIFGKERNPQEQFEYQNLGGPKGLFPGYEFDPYSKTEKSTYKGQVVGEGGLVRGIHGMYTDVALLDVRSMHPASLINMNYFGPYTKNFKDIVDARVAIKAGDFASARKMLDGRLAPYLVDEKVAKALSYALKIAVNMVYGMTSATFPNVFKDPRNIDNIVAKRGALFMIDLMEAVEERGFKVIHTKTDSIKIPNATQEIIDFVFEFGKKYGYDFEHEATYEKFALVNDAVYIAKDAEDGHWNATGAQFAHPFVFKSLFSKEPLEFKDFVETKSVKTALYLDFRTNEDTPMVMDDKELHFVGRVGAFVPVTQDGAELYREKDGKLYFATGAKGYHWLESETVKALGAQDTIDMSYFQKLVDEAVKNLSQFGDFEWLVS